MTRRISAAPTSRRRRMACAVTIAPVLALTLAGCQWTSPIQTDYAYASADGVSTQLGGVDVSNLLVVADKKGSQGTLVGLGVNNTNQPVQVSFAAQDQQPVNLDIKPLSSAQLTDPKGGQKSQIGSVPVDPGALLDVTVSTAGAGSKTLQVPVLAPYAPYGDYSQSGEKTHAPSPAPTQGGHH